MVGADAHRDTALLALEHEWRKTLLDARDLGRVVLVRVLAHAEKLLVGEVAGVDAHLVDVLGGFQGRGRAEVNVGDERDRDAERPQAALDLANGLRIGHRWRGDAHDLAADLDQADGLREGGLDVLGARGRHRLHADGLIAAHDHVANRDFARATPLVGETGGAVGRGREQHSDQIIGSIIAQPS